MIDGANIFKVFRTIFSTNKYQISVKMFIVVKIALLYHCNIVKIARKGSHITILPYFYGTNDRKDDLTPS